MRRFLKVIAINLGLLLMGVIAVELVFGTWFSSDPLDRVNIQRGLQIRVDARGLYPDGTIFTYRRNRWGFRGGDLDPAEIDVLTIGGISPGRVDLAGSDGEALPRARSYGHGG
jgi:hypothetical protein